MTLHPTERSVAIVAAMRQTGNLLVVAERFGVSRQRVHQIVARHEARTGEALPRYLIIRREHLRRRETYRCERCGKERAMIPSVARRHRYCSIFCATRANHQSILTDTIVDELADARIAGQAWYAMARRLWRDSPYNNSHRVISSVYVHLRRQGDARRIGLIWPNGISPWLLKKFGPFNGMCGVDSSERVVSA